MELSVRSILSIPVSGIFEAYEEGVKYEVMYEDGVVINEHREAIIFNRFCWELFSLIPTTTIVSTCSVMTVINGGYFNSNTHVKLLENIFTHVCEFNNIHRYQDKEPLLKACYVIVNNLFNNILHRVSAFVATIDAVDFVSLIKSPAIGALHDALVPTPESVDSTYRGIRSYMTDPSNHNRFVNSYRAKSINENQANQCIGPRGFVTDLTRVVFKQPITNGFIRGMGTLFEIITESLTAAKSLNATDTHICVSEYASRRIQLLTMTITTVDTVDCGSNDYLETCVTERYLPNLKGKWYKILDSDELKCIKGDEKELINRVIKMRSPFHCKTIDPKRICTTCLGRLSENFKENSNLGYTMTSYLMEKLTQAILSTKHLTHSVKKSAIKLEGTARKYFYSTDANNIYFNTDLDMAEVYLVLPCNKLNKLVDVLSLDHTRVALNKIGELDVIGLRTMHHGVQLMESVSVDYKDRMSTITRDMLKHIKLVGFETDARGNFIIPMKTYDKTKPAFSNQLKETNIVSFVNRIASMIEATKNTKLSLEEHFFLFADTVFDQFNCNITILETIIYATTSFNSANGNYRPGRNTPHSKYENKSLLFRNRSAAPMMVFEGSVSEMLKHSPDIFSNNHRTDHPLDVLFAPQDVVSR